MLSKKFLELLAANRPYHRLAWRAGLTPNQVYKITSGIDRPDCHDLRISRLAEILGLEVNKCFEEETHHAG